MDKYSHDSYTVVRATALIGEAVDHLLSQGRSEVPDELRRELQALRGRRKEGGKPREQVEDMVTREGVPFELVRRIHEQLKRTPMGERRVYIHELLKGSELILPTLAPLERNRELVARLERIQAQTDQKEYNRMVRNIDPTVRQTPLLQLGLEVQSTSRQLWAVANLLLTVIGSFVFGYFAAYFSGFGIPACVFVGLGFGLAVLFADMYFLVKSPEVPQVLQPKKSRTSRHPR